MTTSEAYYNKMTKTPVSKLVIMLGIPTMISMLISNIYNMADTYFVGTLGESAQGAIGILFTLQSIIQAIAFMLGHGSGTYAAKHLAEREVNKSSMYVSSAFFLGGAFGLVFSVLGLVFIEPFMRLLGSTETILPYAVDYGFWVLVSCPFLVCSLILNNNLRYEGKTLMAMIGLVSGGLLNVGLDYIFVFPCNLGVFGAGMATAISQVVSFVLLFVFYQTMAQGKISFKFISKKFKTYLQIFRNGSPSLIRQGLNSISGGVLNHIAGYYGGLVNAADATISAMTIVNKISSFVLCVALGISQGLQPVASHNYQLKLYGRVKKALLATCSVGFLFVLVLSLPISIFPSFFIGIFSDKAKVIEIGTPALRYAMFGIMLIPIYTPLSLMYQSIRKAEIASFLALLRNGLVFIPTIFLTSYLWQITGVQIAQPISDFVTGLISIPFFVHFLRFTPKEEQKNLESNAEQNS